VKKLKLWIVCQILRVIYAIQTRLTGVTMHPKCPYCGAPCSTETDEVVYDGDQDDMECDECGREYERYVSFQPEFYTEKRE
jgi:hypothetical protein